MASKRKKSRTSVSKLIEPKEYQSVLGKRKVSRTSVSKLLDPEEDRERVHETKRLLNELDEVDERWGDWAREFLTSINDWFYNQGRPLTDAQFNRLKSLHSQYVK